MSIRLLFRCSLVALLSCIAQVGLAETLVALTSSNALLTFDSATPGTISQTALISGLAFDETLIGIDSRPADGLLYGLSSEDKLYRLDHATGVATFVGTLTTPLNGTSFGIDFNPTVDRIRVVSEANDNVRVIPPTQSVLTDTAVNYGAGDVNVGADPFVGAVAYLNNFAGATVTTMYVIDSALDILAIASVPNAGTLQTIGVLGLDTSTLTGFDISQNGVAYAALGVGGLGASSLFTINLVTGTATLVGQIGLGFPILGLTGIDLGFSPTENEPMLGLTTDNQLVRFGSATPGTLDSTTVITGLAGGESLWGMDIRPLTLELYGISSLDQLYTIDVQTGVATLVAATNVALNGNAFGVDFNPTVDRIRLVSDLAQNIRINPLSATVLEDTNLSYAIGDSDQFATPSIVASAYTNNFSGAATTVLYDIDSGTNSLAQQNPPNEGKLVTVGTLGADTGNEAGFDISGRSGIAYAALSTRLEGASVFYTVDLVSAKVSMVGSLGTTLPLRDITVGAGWATADQDQDNAISLSELLRVIQFFSSGGLYCANAPTDTEDGFVPGPAGLTACLPHTSDYLAQDWNISLTELLRLVQLYNAGQYRACPSEATEDGFCLE